MSPPANIPQDTPENKTVFISYRRSVSSFHARSVFQDLTQQGYDVFFDVESINAGQFEQIIINQIRARTYFILILNTGSLNRCNEPDDWLRREIETAIEAERKIILLFMENFELKDAEAFLTGRLAGLGSYNGRRVPHDLFNAAMQEVRERFLVPDESVKLDPIPPENQEAVQRKLDLAKDEPKVQTAELDAENFFAQATVRPEDDLDGKLADYDQAITLNPRYAEAYNNRGKLYLIRGELDTALADFDQAIKYATDHPTAYINRGVVHRRQGNLQTALDDYTQAIRLDSRNPISYNNRANVYDDLGQTDEALQDFDRAIKRDLNYIDAYYNRAELHEKLGDIQAAIQDYQRYLDLGGGQRDGDEKEVIQRIRKLKQQL